MTSLIHHQIALTLLPQVGAVTARLLVSYCGSAEAVFRASRKELLKIPGIGPGIVSNIHSSNTLVQAEEELQFMEQNGIEAVFYTDAAYPARLRQNADSPVLLYFKGSSIELLNAARIVGVVGTRQPTDYGRAVCEELVEGLRAYDVLIVSGLAYGIDITAHRKAIAQGMPNLGILGHGLQTIYPGAHRSSALKMTENGGLLSEYTHRTGPDREHFPMRNRIIAGLSDALLVVETAQSGGSMITAELACQYGRELFAVPGRLRDSKSAGCNQLIRTHRARLVETAADMAANMNWGPAGKQKAVQPQLFPELSSQEIELVDLIRQQPQIPIDALSMATRHAPGDLAALLLGLEFKGLIRTLPGKRYEAV